MVSFGANCVPEELVCRAGWPADRPFVREAVGMGTTKAWSVGPYLGGWLVGWSGRRWRARALHSRARAVAAATAVGASPSPSLSLPARETEPRGGWRSSAQHAVLELWRETEESEGEREEGEDCVTEPANQPTDGWRECWINSELDET